MTTPLRFAAFALLLAACAQSPPSEHWTDATGAHRGADEFARDQRRCNFTHAGTGLDPRDRLKADDCAATRAASISCMRSDTAERTDSGAAEACLRAAGWARASGSAPEN